MAPSFKEFDETSEKWSTYVKRLKQYFVVNDIEEDKQVPSILLYMGSKFYDILETLVTPKASESKTLDEIINLIEGDLNPAKLNSIVCHKLQRIHSGVQFASPE